MVLPIAVAPATLPPVAFFGNAPFTEGSTVDAEAIVLPLASSTTCTYTCETLRKIVSRGRSPVPLTRRRMRYLMRWRRSSLVLIFIPLLGGSEDPPLLGPRLSDLLLQLLAGVADALLL